MGVLVFWLGRLWDFDQSTRAVAFGVAAGLFGDE